MQDLGKSVDTIKVYITNQNLDSSNPYYKQYFNPFEGGTIGNLSFPDTNTSGEGFTTTGNVYNVTLEASNNWSKELTITDSTTGDGYLPATYDGQECRYFIVEDNVPDGYSVTYSENNAEGLGLNSTGTLTAYNHKTSTSIQLIKQDQENRQPLEGAEFKIYRLASNQEGAVLLKGENDAPLYTVRTNASGASGLIPNLTLGCYAIVETQAPDHYRLPGEDDTIYIRVTPHGVERITKYDNRIPDKWPVRPNDSYVMVNATNSVITITVGNTPSGQPITLRKRVAEAYDSNKTALGGAEFVLYKLENYNNGSPMQKSEFGLLVDVDQFQSDKLTMVSRGASESYKGIFFRGYLPYGRYVLKETGAPDGYVLHDPIELWVKESDDDGKVLWYRDYQQGQADDVNWTRQKRGSDNTYSVYVDNTPTELSLTKQLSGDYPPVDSSTKLFTFHVVLSGTGLAQGQTYNLAWTGTARPSTVTEQQAASIVLPAAVNNEYTVDIKLVAGETVTIRKLPAGVTYTVSEINNPAGYSETTASQGGTKSGTIGDTLSSVTIKNKYTATGSTTLTAKKTFTNGSLANQTFQFWVTQVDALNSDTAVSRDAKLSTNPTNAFTSTAGNTTEQTVTLATINFTQADVGQDFFFKIEEVLPEGVSADNPIDPNTHIRYDTTPKWVKVSVADNGDGTLTITKTDASGATIAEDAPDAAFTNEQLGELQITKQILRNGTLNTDGTGTFYFAVYNAAYDASADPAMTPVATGSIQVTTGGTDSAHVPNLSFGTYYVYELTGENGTPIVSDNDGVHQPMNGITYLVKNSGTTTTVGSTAGTVTLQNDQETTTVTVDKKWFNGDTDITGTIQNASVTVQLKNGDTVIDQDVDRRAFGTNGNVTLPITTTDANTNEETTTWAYTWSNLPKYDSNGAEISYTVVETSAKVETDTELLKSGTSVTATQDSTNTTRFHLENRLHDRTYKVKKTWGEGQQPPEGAEIVITLGGTITVGETSTPVVLTDLGVSKITATLNGGQKNDQEAYTGDDTAEKQWEYEWTNLPKYDNDGHEITYSATETSYKINGVEISLTDYIPSNTTVDGYDVFTNKIPTTTFETTKAWVNSNNNTPPAGATITVTLYKGATAATATTAVSSIVLNGTADGTIVGGAWQQATGETTGTADAYEDSAWHAKWSNLPKYDEAGKPLVYVAKETAYTGYTPSYVKLSSTDTDTGNTTETDKDYALNSETITNTEEEITLRGSKTWYDDAVAGGARPADLEIKLFKVTTTGNPESETETELALQHEHENGYYYLTWEKPDNSNVWTYTITHLPKKDADGAIIKYRVKETVPTGYTAVNEYSDGQVDAETGNVTGADFTNIEWTNINVTKAWKKADGTDYVPAEAERTILFKVFYTYENENTVQQYTTEADDEDGNYTITYTQADGAIAASWSTVTLDKLPLYKVVSSVDSSSGQTVETVKKIAGYYAVEQNTEGKQYAVTYSTTYQDAQGTNQTVTGQTATAVTNGAITIINTNGKITVTKTFTGIDALPDDFTITASWPVADSQASSGDSGSGESAAASTKSIVLKATEDATGDTTGLTITRTKTDAVAAVPASGDTPAVDGIPASYTWTIEGLPIGTEVSFTESGYSVGGYTWAGTVKGPTDTAAKAGTSGKAKVTSEGETVAFTNTYAPGVELPATGGRGTLAFTLSGLALMMLAGVLMISRKRRNNR